MLTLEDAWSGAAKILATKFLLSFSTCGEFRELLSAGAHLLLDVLGYSKPVGLKQIATIQFVLCRFAVESGNRGGQRDDRDEMSGLLRYANVFEREEHGQHLSSKDRSARAHAARTFIAGETFCQNSDESLGLLLSLCRHVDVVDVSPRTFLAEGDI